MCSPVCPCSESWVIPPVCPGYRVGTGPEGGQSAFSKESRFPLFSFSQTHTIYGAQSFSPQLPPYHFLFPFVFLALGFLALKPTKFFCGNMGFLFEAKCSLNWKDKQNISEVKYHLRSMHITTLYNMYSLWIGTSRAELYGVGKEDTASCPSRAFHDPPDGGMRLFTFSQETQEWDSSTHTHYSLSLISPLLSGGIFCIHSPSSFLNGRGKGKKKIHWKQSNPDQIRIA